MDDEESMGLEAGVSLWANAAVAFFAPASAARVAPKVKVPEAAGEEPKDNNDAGDIVGVPDEVELVLWRAPADPPNENVEDDEGGVGTGGVKGDEVSVGFGRGVRVKVGVVDGTGIWTLAGDGVVVGAGDVFGASRRGVGDVPWEEGAAEVEMGVVVDVIGVGVGSDPVGAG